MGSFVTTAFKATIGKTVGDGGTVGADLGILLVSAAQTPTRAMLTVDQVTAEVTGTDYHRANSGILGGVRVDGDVLIADWVDGDGPIATPLFQTADVSEIAGAWTYLIPEGVTDDGTHDDQLLLVAYTSVPTGPGSDDWPLQRVDGYARIGDTDTTATLVATLGTSTATAGQVLSVATTGAPPTWAEPTSLTVSDNLIAPLVAAYGTLPQVATMLPHLQVMDDLFAQVIGLTGATDPDWATQVEEITDLFGFTFAGGGSGPKPLEHRLLGFLAAIAGLNLKVDTRQTTFTDALTALGTDADAATDVDGLKAAIATFVGALT